MNSETRRALSVHAHAPCNQSMEVIKDVVSGIVQNKPLSEVIQGVKQQRLANESTQARVNPIFDDLRGDAELHPRWHFCSTLGRTTPAPLDLYRMLRELTGTVPLEAHATLDDLSQQVNALRARIGQETATEQDLCLYLHFLGTMAQHVENSPSVYRVDLAADNDGVNGQVAGAHTVQYDSWHLERIITVLRLFMLHANPRDTLSAKQRIEQYQRCGDYLRELQTLCIAPSTGAKRMYRRPLTSLSSGSESEQRQQAQYPSARTFVELYMGGQAGIETRVHLCEAQRRHEIYRDLVERQLGESDDGLLAMGAIAEAYELARLASERQHKDNKLSHHTRFMQHMWTCKTNLAIAQREAKKGDTTALSEALQRVECISRLHRARSFDKRSFVLGAELVDLYNPMIRAADLAFRDWDQQLEGAGVHPPAREFVLEKASFAEKPSLYVTAMTQCAATLRAPLQLLDTLLRATTLLPALSCNTNGTTPCTTLAMQELMKHAKDGDSARLGALAMQEAWIEWILQLEAQGEFIMNVQYAELLLREKVKTREALARHKS